ncbi:MAG: 30S ribosomal protein S13 [Candidatus Omnitrophica bacterium]|nr:30S ribosomal protein S13 [Candidatus Omnitrophota bacterium]MCM8777458.1 30S ribosomal protein S13 [Candidatus Omnitrophota bacterium]
MARILGVEIPDNKKVEISLTYIYGIGRTTAKQILISTGIDGNKRVKDLKEEEIGKIASFLQKNYTIEGDLRKKIAEDIRRLIEISTYRGIRHRLSLPVRGQRTRSNARTRKGPRKTVGVIRDKTARKAIKAQREETKKEG